MILENKVCEIITDTETLNGISDVIDPKKEGTKLQQIILKLKATMRANDLVSLSAPQIGELYRVFCIKFGKDDYRSFVNPMIENVSGFQLSREKCHSIPNKEFIRPRYNSIRIIYQTPMGKVEARDIKGKTAIVMEHCIDHLDGLLLNDVGLEIDEMFDNATEEERTEVIKMYMESLDIRQKQLEQEIENDKELKQLNDGIKFMNAVDNGEVTLDTE